MAHVEPEVEVHLDGLVELALRPARPQHPDGLRRAGSGRSPLAVDLARVADSVRRTATALCSCTVRTHLRAIDAAVPR